MIAIAYPLPYAMSARSQDTIISGTQATVTAGGHPEERNDWNQPIIRLEVIHSQLTKAEAEIADYLLGEHDLEWLAVTFIDGRHYEGFIESYHVYATRGVLFEATCYLSTNRRADPPPPLVFVNPLDAGQDRRFADDDALIPQDDESASGGMDGDAGSGDLI